MSVFGRNDLASGATGRSYPTTTAQTRHPKAGNFVPWLLIAFVATLTGIWLSQTQNLGVRLDGALYDLGLTARAPRPTKDVVIVGLTEAFMQRRQAALMPRDRLARLIRILATAKPSVIVLDIWLDSFQDNDERNSNPHGIDAKLRAALEAAKREGVPVLLAQVSTAGTAGRDEAPLLGRKPGTFNSLTGITGHGSPLPYFVEAASGVGNVDGMPDADGIFRSLPRSSVALPSLSLQAAIRHAAHTKHPLNKSLIDRLQSENTPLDFIGGPDSIRITPSDELLDQPFKAIVFGDQAVFVGATYERSTDFVGTPYSLKSAPGDRLMYGVEVLAQAATTILAGAPRHPFDSPQARLQIGVVVFGLALIVTGMALRGVPWGIATFLAVVLLGGAASITSAQTPNSLVGNHFWPLSPLLFSSLLACAGGIGCRQMRSAKELRELTNIFQGHVGKQVLEQIKVKRPELGGELRDVAVLFCDIRGFSAISEQLRDDPVRVLSLLNEHFEPLVRALEHREAYTDNYVGDLVMGVFGAPFSRSLASDTRHAVLAGVDFVRIMRERGLVQRQKGEAVIEAGVGIHCGPAVVGYLGTREHMHYTAVGDTVNIAARIEGSTRNYNEPLLVTEDVVHVCGDVPELPASGWEFVAETKLKGRDAPVKLYRRSDIDALVAASQAGAAA